MDFHHPYQDRNNSNDSDNNNNNNSDHIGEEEDDGRLGRALSDPRLEIVRNGYASSRSNNVSKCRLHAEYRARVVRAISSVSLDDDGRTLLRSFTGQVRSLVQDMGRRGLFGRTEDLEVALSKCTDENVLRELTERNVKRFLRDGMDDTTRMFLISGWAAFLVVNSTRPDGSYTSCQRETARSISGVDPERLPGTD